ncbi:MAG: YggT family protein [Candidatus Aminicenantes bacterium]|nr:YggT family protein [Candidatus Aminicenantes bacterium]
MIPANILRALAQVFHTLIRLYTLVIIARAVISWLGNIPPNPLVMIIFRLTDPLFRFIHRRMPFLIVGGIDITPMIIVFALYLLDNLVTGLILDFAGTLP